MEYQQSAQNLNLDSFIDSSMLDIPVGNHRSDYFEILLQIC